MMTILAIACNWRSLCPAACWSSSTGRSQSRQDGSSPRTGSRCRCHHLFFFCEIFRNSSLSQICEELNHFGKIRRLLKSWSRQQQQMETRFLEMTRCPIDWLMWTTISFLQSSSSCFQMTEALKSLYVPEDTVAAISTGDKLKEAFSEVTVSGDYEIENVEAFIVDNCKRVFQYSQK